MGCDTPVKTSSVTASSTHVDKMFILAASRIAVALIALASVRTHSHSVLLATHLTTDYMTNTQVGITTSVPDKRQFTCATGTATCCGALVNVRDGLLPRYANLIHSMLRL